MKKMLLIAAMLFMPMAMKAGKDKKPSEYEANRPAYPEWWNKGYEADNTVVPEWTRIVTLLASDVCRLEVKCQHCPNIIRIISPCNDSNPTPCAFRCSCGGWNEPLRRRRIFDTQPPKLDDSRVIKIINLGQEEEQLRRDIKKKK